MPRKGEIPQETPAQPVTIRKIGNRLQELDIGVPQTLLVVGPPDDPTKLHIHRNRISPMRPNSEGWFRFGRSIDMEFEKETTVFSTDDMDFRQQTNWSFFRFRTIFGQRRQLSRGEDLSTSSGDMESDSQRIYHLHGVYHPATEAQAVFLLELLRQNPDSLQDVQATENSETNNHIEDSVDTIMIAAEPIVQTTDRTQKVALPFMSGAVFIERERLTGPDEITITIEEQVQQPAGGTRTQTQKFFSYGNKPLRQHIYNKDTQAYSEIQNAGWGKTTYVTSILEMLASGSTKRYAEVRHMCSQELKRLMADKEEYTHILPGREVKVHRWDDQFDAKVVPIITGNVLSQEDDFREQRYEVPDVGLVKLYTERYTDRDREGTRTIAGINELTTLVGILRAMQ